MMSFDHFNLHPNIAKSIQACGYTKPTPVQNASILPIMQGKDVVVSAQTGTGKTAAFILPALHLLSSSDDLSPHPSILVLTPTRELAGQIAKAVMTYGKFSRVRVANIVGGVSYDQQIRDLKRGVDIVIATPGRLIDHIERGRVRFDKLKLLVLDEADRMLDMGFSEDVQSIARLTPVDCQVALFSATVDKKLVNEVGHLLKNPVRIDLSQNKIAAPHIKQDFYKVSGLQQKTKLLKHLISEKQIYKAIIFSATKSHADKLAGELRADGFSAAALHGDLRQSARNRTVEDLRRGRVQYLVATDVAARGLDINDITHVINFDLPKLDEDYVHRIGRTGRAGKEGQAISFVLPADTKHVQRIERYVGLKFKFIHIDTASLPVLDMAPAFAQASHEPDEEPRRHQRHFRRDARRDEGSSHVREKRFGASEAGYKKSFSGGKKPWNKDRDASSERRSSRDTHEERPRFERKKPWDKNRDASSERRSSRDTHEERPRFERKKPWDKNRDASSERRPSRDAAEERPRFERKKPWDKDRDASSERRPSRDAHEERPRFERKKPWDKDRDASSERRPSRDAASENKKPWKKRDASSTDQKKSWASRDDKPFGRRKNTWRKDEESSNASSKKSGGFDQKSAPRKRKPKRETTWGEE